MTKVQPEETMYEMNVLATFCVVAGLYLALFYVAEKLFMQDKD